MKKTFYILSMIGLTLTSCSNTGTYNITNETVGPLLKTATVKELFTVFKNDSLVDAAGRNDFKTPQGEVTVYEKGGKKLLVLTPDKTTSDSKIKYIQVLDSRYKTLQGITLKSTFADIENNYKIRRVENLIGAVVIFVEDSDVYFTIDKKHLPGDIRFNTNVKIEVSQIPGDAPIKYLQIGWK